MREVKFFLCTHCGNIVGLINDAGVPLMCCGQKMKPLVPGEIEASAEKHVPVVDLDGNTVKVSVGIDSHPMTEEHRIKWVYLLTDRGGHRKCLSAGEAPEVSFALIDEKPIAVYAYCNLHGLWKKDI